MSYRILDGPEAVTEYIRYLDEGWPERTAIADHICERLARIPGDTLRILEVCCGPGELAAAVLDAALVREYVAVDISEASLDYAKRRTAKFDPVTVWLQADVNEDKWLDEIEAGFDAVVSMQSIHDLGGEAEVARIYGIARRMLKDKGRFVNADLLRTPFDVPGSNLGRFTVSRHLELLNEAGFDRRDCTLRLGGFGCFEAIPCAP